MRRTFGTWLAILAFVAVGACGDGGKDGSAAAAPPVGSWTMDREKTIESGIAAAKKAGVGAKLTDKEIREHVTKDVAAGTLRLVFKADKTLTLETKGLSEDATGVGTWTRDGDRVAITLTTKNGKPTEGADRQPATLAVRGDRLVMLAPDGEEMFWLKRP